MAKKTPEQILMALGGFLVTLPYLKASQFRAFVYESLKVAGLVWVYKEYTRYFVTPDDLEF